MGLKKEDFMDGSLLSYLIKQLEDDPSDENKKNFLILLKDCDVFVPFCPHPVDLHIDDPDIPSTVMFIGELARICSDDKYFIPAYPQLDNEMFLGKKGNVLRINFQTLLEDIEDKKDIAGVSVMLKNEDRHLVDKTILDFYRDTPSAIEPFYTYVKVAFPDKKRTYYYQTDDKSIKVGDKVIVPWGQYDDEKVARVIQVEHITDGNVPFDYFKTKEILRKSTEPHQISRNSYKPVILLYENETMEMLKKEVDNGEYEFDWDIFYSHIATTFILGSGSLPYYVPAMAYADLKVAIDKVLPQVEEYEKQKPLYAQNSVGQHWANELFYEGWSYPVTVTQPYFWAYLARKFAAYPLPMTKEEFTRIYYDILKKYEGKIPEDKYESIAFTDYSYKGKYLRLNRLMVDYVLRTLLKNLDKFDEIQKSLIQDDMTFAYSEGDLFRLMGETVKIITAKKEYMGEVIKVFARSDTKFEGIVIQNGNKEVELTVFDIVSIEEDGTLEDLR